MDWTSINALPRRTQRQRQVWEAIARQHEAVVNQRRKAQEEFDAQVKCGQEFNHFRTAPLPELLGQARCIACGAIVDPLRPS